MAIQKRLVASFRNDTVRVVMLWDDVTGAVSGFETTCPKDRRVEVTIDAPEGKESFIREKVDLSSSLVTTAITPKVGRWKDDPDQTCPPYLLGELSIAVRKA